MYSEFTELSKLEPETFVGDKKWTQLYSFSCTLDIVVLCIFNYGGLQFQRYFDVSDVGFVNFQRKIFGLIIYLS